MLLSDLLLEPEVGQRYGAQVHEEEDQHRLPESEKNNGEEEAADNGGAKDLWSGRGHLVLAPGKEVSVESLGAERWQRANEEEGDKEHVGHQAVGRHKRRDIVGKICNHWHQDQDGAFASVRLLTNGRRHSHEKYPSCL